ncbi:hypothetical protein C0J52_22048 [Blattella germanica]|nr:hypothetical protein C0J52_22048 [Blattella germanica]
MDDIKQEFEEFKLEWISDEPIDVNECSDHDFKPSLNDQKIKSEKQDLIYEHKQNLSEIEDKNFDLISLACVKEEVDVDSNSE